MKRICSSFIILLLTFFNSTAEPANLELIDINGHAGIVYTAIRINDAPNPVSYLKISLSYDSKSYASAGDPTIGIAKNNVSYSQGIFGGYKTFEIYLGDPLPKGFSGPILKFPFYIDGTKRSMSLMFFKVEGDIENWTTKDGNFTYIEDDNQNPVAEAGIDHFIISSLVIDGSKSYDPDGIVTKWDWLFSHRTNSAYNRNASGKNISLSDLAAGIYDIQLTITDNAGLTAHDYSTLGVSGARSGIFTVPGDANSDAVVGLDDIIISLQFLSGIRQ